MRSHDSGHALLVDFGSTFTKLLLVDLQSGAVVARAIHPTTVQEGIAVGLHAGLAALAAAAGRDGRRLVRCASPRLACSSAAGGLKMIAIGLVPDLTVTAATRAALGAGANLLATYGHRLTPGDTAAVARLRPDVILLTGGTDGGNRQVVLENACALAALPPEALGPIVVAGNKEATSEATWTLRSAGHDARPAANVLPELGTLHIEPAQAAIRDVFLERIVQSKGLDIVLDTLDGVMVPTPAAVLRAAEVLADDPPCTPPFQTNTPLEPLGELMVVDLGGATTDVHSVGDGGPSRPNVYRRGIPEPRVKRTVEGDLGLRVSATSLWRAIGDRWEDARMDAATCQARLASYTDKTDQIPNDEQGTAFDAWLAAHAVALAVERHAGSLEEIATPAGRFWTQRGKDLTAFSIVIGTGGIFHAHTGPLAILQAALAEMGSREPTRLVPRNARVCVDHDYVLWASGLLAATHQEAAKQLAWRSVQRPRS
jgi:uncharacterized protein (TIGR01319 family)